ATGEGAAEGVGARAFEGVAEIDDRQVGLDRGAFEAGHRGRVVDHDRGVAFVDARARERGTEGLDAVFLELEARRMGRSQGQDAGDAECKGRSLEKGGGTHCLELLTGASS